MPTPTIRFLEARFDLPLRHEQVPQWRGAFAEWVGEVENSDLFHNHANGAAEEYHHRYPQVQYRSVRGKATLIAMNDGIEAVAGLFQRPGDWSIRWEGIPQPLRLEQMHFDTCELGLLPNGLREYRLLRWLALNEDNYHIWKQLGTFRERVELLDRTLAANLLSLCSGLNWKIPRRFEAHLTLVERIGSAQVHGVEVMTFDCRFATDLVLPVGLGMGKSSSLGFGVLLPVRSKNSTTSLHPHRHELTG